MAKETITLGINLRKNNNSHPRTHETAKPETKKKGGT